MRRFGTISRVLLLSALCCVGCLPCLAQHSVSGPAYPLKQSADKRYLVDQKGAPFLIAGDAPQALMVNLTEADAEIYFANRQAHGFNTVWINLVCNDYTGGRKDGTTFDGVRPFTTPGDLTTPNEVYFARCDRMLRLAARHKLLVLLDPIETGGWMGIMLANGPEKCRAFGRFLGNRYRGFDNLLWMSGNDFQGWRDANNDAAVTAVALGIKDRDMRHLHTIELDYNVSGSVDDPKWVPIIGLNASYTYYPTYARVLQDYSRPEHLPVFMVESDYEGEHNSTPAVLRREEYWSLLSGAAGQVYGNGMIWPFSKDWKSQLESPGAVEMAYVTRLFEPRPWYRLVPDQKHTLVTVGYGSFDATARKDNQFGAKGDYLTAARTRDGRLAIIYMPSVRDISVDMSQMSGPFLARWYDPSRGVSTVIAAFPNRGSHDFSPPGKNGDGDGDWVLLLEAAAPHGVAGRPHK